MVSFLVKALLCCPAKAAGTYSPPPSPHSTSVLLAESDQEGAPLRVPGVFVAHRCEPKVEEFDEDSPPSYEGVGLGSLD
ncbi:hypothetical protein P9112_003794 [Eukaryota sp. TZLM1-RC]